MNTLVFRHTPWLEWLVGLAFIGGGVAAFVGGERVFGGGFIAAAAGLILGFANTVTNSFDRGTGRLTCSTKGLLRNREVSYPLGDIRKVYVEASPTANPSRRYRVALSLNSGVRVPLTTAYSSGKADKERMASQIRQFLNLPEPPEVSTPGFGEVVGMLFEKRDSDRERQP